MRKLLICFVAITIATSLCVGSKIEANDIVSKTNYKIGGQNVLSSYNRINIIVPNSSRVDREIARLALEKSKDTTQRETLSRYKSSSKRAVGESPSYEMEQVGVEIVRTDYTNNCTVFAKQQTGINRTLGAGARDGINSSTPKVGAIMSERSIIHSGIVESILDRGVVIIESNYIKNKITRRFIPYSDVLGYIYK